MRAVRRASAVALAAATVFAGASLLAPSPAFAYPQRCHVRLIDGSEGHSYCAGGSGGHRVVVSCRQPGAQNITKYGPWKRPGNFSRVYCDAERASIQVLSD